MEIFLLISILAIPVLLLASPLAILTLKGRPDIALYYLIAMLLVQITVLVTHWGQMTQAALWVMVLIAISQALGCALTWHKTRERYWALYCVSVVILNTALILIGQPSLISG